MPEIWLGYGDSEIILDIKYENISQVLRPSMNKLDLITLENEIKSKIVIQESTLILITSPFFFFLPILSVIQNMSKELNIEKIEYCILSKSLPQRVKQQLNENSITIGRLASEEVLEKVKKFDNIILIDRIEYDPVFGYAGSPVRLLRECYPDEMNQVYTLIFDSLPQPGTYNEPLKLAVEVTSKMSCQSIHVISNNEGIDSVFIGDLSYSFNEAIQKFKSITQPSAGSSKSAFISGNTNFSCQMTLGNSLNLLWNNYHVISDNGIIILLSESRGGVGNGTLLKLIENRLDVAGLNKYQYSKDLEHINFLKMLREKYEIYLISSLPRIYTDKLGLKSLQRIKDGLDLVIEKNGKYSKSIIIPNSEITRVSS
jgi:nickel-dependent lactate racemase